MSFSPFSSDSDRSESRMILDRRPREPEDEDKKRPTFRIVVDDGTIVKIDEASLRTMSKKVDKKFNDLIYLGTTDEEHICPWMRYDVAVLVRHFVHTMRLKTTGGHVFAHECLRAAKWLGLKELAYAIFHSIQQEAKKEKKEKPESLYSLDAMIWLSKFAFDEETDNNIEYLYDLAFEALSYENVKFLMETNFIDKKMHPVPRALCWQLFSKVLLEKKSEYGSEVAS